MGSRAQTGLAEAESRCPFSGHHQVARRPGAAGCPVSHEAGDFDPFDAAYQYDPVEALRWSRDREPVFFSPKLGYWVVTRYEDVKAAFRNNVALSPANALEKITPNSDEANAILARYGYAMNRTLVNEDEPVHMERRRALLHSFLPEELVHHEPMVRRLAREYVDRFIDRGHADLVDEMLWEIPLTVALHFLGVPEEDMNALRRYSIAHTVNTWGRPTPKEQLAVAEAVGQFWKYAGEVLEKMRADPSGHGWMEYAIRKQKEMPDVVTDSYLHSMMMAGIVAAHETTANATGNAMRILLQDRHLWEQICADPSLIPNAVEECLRLSGSIVAWRRVALEDVQIGGLTIPKGDKLLLVMTSANHDERHFDNPDIIDLYRDNSADHLSFGYGSHQCMGKNLARMEMRIFLEEFTRRLPHMELVPDQTFDYLPNVSFRGPEHVLVRWDPANNPERTDNSVVDRVKNFPIGSPQTKDIARTVRVTSVKQEADGVVGITLASPDGRALPSWRPGAHIDLIVGSVERKYSLCGSPENTAEYKIAVLKDENGRGGSVRIHAAVKADLMVKMRGPRSHFRLDETEDNYQLIAGGIGITPIIAMADRLKQLGKSYTLHYCGRSRSSMAFLDRLQHDHGHGLKLYVGADGKRMNLSAVLQGIPQDAPVYACGPSRLLDALTELVGDQQVRLRVEHFSTAGAVLSRDDDTEFEVQLADSGLTVTVPRNQTLLQALQSAGIDVPSDCGEGLCGTCEVPVHSGDVDHRDIVLTASERNEGRRMMACCSRGKGKLVLGL